MTTLTHKTVKAAATATDRGAFSAIAATYSVDRVKDRIIPGAFAKTISAWQGSGKRVPLHWDHESSADSIIGWVEPATMRETDEGLYVEGELDIKASAVAREAWRSMKNNAVSLSFGYLTTQERKSKDGINELLELDLFEISIVPAPANADTRILSVKAVKEIAGLPTDETSTVEDGSDEEPETVKSAPQDPLVREAWDLITRNAYGGPLPKSLPEPDPEPEPEPLDVAQVQREAWELVLKTRSG